MKPATLHQIRIAVGGKALAAIPQNAPAISRVCTNSKQIEPGCIFVAIQGDRFDAHKFIPDAAAAGAVAAIIHHPPAHAMPNMHLIQVPDTRIALGKLATFARQHMRAQVIAVAGSNGKTTTKYLIDAVLSSKFRGSMSPKSFNNDIGVPLTILPADANDDYLVLEIGTNHPGEVAHLSQIATPDIAVITNCGAEHLEFLGDLDGVRKENASIVKDLRTRGRGAMLAVNGDDPELLEAVRAYRGKTLKFGFNPTGNDLFATDIHCDITGTRFLLNGGHCEFFVPLIGKHNACNALAAIAVARRLGMSDDEIAHALTSAHGPEMRLQLVDARGVTIVHDAYNANPNSMRAAIDTLASLLRPPRAKRIAVLGDMLELGETSEKYHREIGEFAAKSGKLDLLVCVGSQASLIAESAVDAGMNKRAIKKFRTAKSAASALPALLHSGDVVLLKASRGIGLETVADAIIRSRPGARRLHKRAS